MMLSSYFKCFLLASYPGPRAERGKGPGDTALVKTGPDRTGPDRTGPDRTGPDRKSDGSSEQERQSSPAHIAFVRKWALFRITC